MVYGQGLVCRDGLVGDGLIHRDGLVRVGEGRVSEGRVGEVMVDEVRVDEVGVGLGDWDGLVGVGYVVIGTVVLQGGLIGSAGQRICDWKTPKHLSSL